MNRPPEEPGAYQSMLICKWAGGVSQKDIYFFKRRLEAHPISQGGYKILGESNREKGLATGVAGEGLWGSECFAGWLFLGMGVV